MSDYEIKMTLAKNIKRLLAERGLTQSDLAKYMNVSSSTVSDWCSGKKMLRMDKVEKMCDFFRCENSDLLFDYVPTNRTSVPLLGGMAAGVGSNLSILENIEKPAFINADCAFVVRGESMASCNIHTDDIIYIKRGVYSDGTIHCVRTPDGYVLKKLYRANNGFMLLSDIEPIIVSGEQEDYEVIGKAVYKLQAV